MKSADCIFCKIIAQEIPTSIIRETDSLLVIKDINPKAPIHYLIMPKSHIESIQNLSDSEQNLAGSLLLMARELSADLPKPGGFRLHINSGADVGQAVPHLHFHFLAGRLPPTHF